jgi:CRISPR system Cascade subunit CasB
MPGSKWVDLTPIGALVEKRISALQSDVIANRSAGIAALARLRRAAGKEPGTVLDVLQYTMAPELSYPGADDNPTAAENAAHISMTLYAVHQQSKGQRMHQRGHGLGRAIRKLSSGDSVADSVLRRFTVLGSANSLERLAYHARGIVQLLRAQQIPVDYGLLTDQLVRWQKPGGAAKVRLQWGRDFYRIHKSDSATESSLS